MNIDKEVAPHAEVAQGILLKGGTLNDVLLYLREHGKTKIDCILVLVDVFGFSNKQAKLFVHHSPAMNDVRVRDEILHERLEEEFGGDVGPSPHRA